MPHTLIAYLDPGTGSFVLQAAAGVVVGAGFVVRGFWYRISGMFTRKNDKTSDQ